MTVTERLRNATPTPRKTLKLVCTRAMLLGETLEYRGAIRQHRDQASGLPAARRGGASHPTKRARYIHLSQRSYI